MFIIKQINLDSGVTISEQYCDNKQKSIEIACKLHKYRENKVIVLDLRKKQGYCGFKAIFSLPLGRTFDDIVKSLYYLGIKL